MTGIMQGGWAPRKVPIRLEIYDKDLGGNAGQTFRTSNAVIHWGGDISELQPRICPASLSVRMLLERPQHYDFHEDLKLAQEDRFTVKVLYGPDVKFIGNIIHDQLRKEDTNNLWTPGLRFNAADGLEKFKTIEYKSVGGNLYDGNNWEPLTEHIRRIFLLLDTRDFFGAAQGVFITSDMYEAQMNASDDNFLQFLINNQVFLKRVDNSLEAMTCYEVLDIICKVTNTRLIQMDGFWIFEDLNHRLESSNFKRFLYNIDMAPAGSTLFDSSLDIQVNFPVPNGRAGDLRLRQGFEESYPPLRTVNVKYDHGTGLDYLHGKLFDFFGEIGQLYANLGVAPVPDDVTRLKFLGTLEILPKWDAGTDSNRYRFIFRFRIRIGDTYYERLPQAGVPPFLVGNYQKEEWTTTVPPVGSDGSGDGEFAWLYPGWISQEYDDQRRIPVHFEILTFPIPEALDGEDVSIGIRYDLFDQDSNLTTEAPFTVQIQMEDGQVLIVDEENSKVEQSAIVATELNEISNSLDYSIDIPTSDGPNDSAPHRLKVKPTGGSDEPEASSWSTNRYGPAHHYTILAAELMHRRILPRDVLDGAIYTANSLYRNFTYCGNTMVFLKGSIDLGTTIVDGQWLYKKTIPTRSLTEEIRNESQDTGGKPIRDGQNLILPPGGRPQFLQITEETSEIIPDFDVPDLSGLSDLDLMHRIRIELRGVKQRITTPETVDGYTWDNANKKILTDEPLRPGDWVFILWDVGVGSTF